MACGGGVGVVCGEGAGCGGGVVQAALCSKGTLSGLNLPNSSSVSDTLPSLQSEVKDKIVFVFFLSYIKIFGNTGRCKNYDY